MDVVCRFVGGRFIQVFGQLPPHSGSFTATADRCLVNGAHVRMSHRPTDGIYICKAFLLAILGLPLTFIFVNGLPILENEHVSTSMSLPMLHTSGKSANSPLTMKKPCTLYLVERGILPSESAQGSDSEETSWVCELDAEDRVRIASFRLIHTPRVSILTLVLFLLLVFKIAVSPICCRPHSTRTLL
jgi:hypothetical protein